MRAKGCCHLIAGCVHARAHGQAQAQAQTDREGVHRRGNGARWGRIGRYVIDHGGEHVPVPLASGAPVPVALPGRVGGHVGLEGADGGWGVRQAQGGATAGQVVT